jgi:hypothetical protein
MPSGLMGHASNYGILGCDRDVEKERKEGEVGLCREGNDCTAVCRRLIWNQSTKWAYDVNLLTHPKGSRNCVL